MSLSSWFRDYVYIPLGGNRVSPVRFLFNIMLVWMLTGFWHGADWNFILWGGFFGIVLLIEKFFLGGVLTKAPRLIRHLYVLVVVFISWAFFDAPGFGEAFALIGRMFGSGIDAIAGREALYYLRSYAVPFALGAVGSTPIPRRVAEKINTNTTVITALEPIVTLLVLIASTAKIIDGSFNPFIYFRF